MKTRSGNVDLAKFVAAILIMTHHMYHLGIKEYPFYDCWIYVEFFLLVTGYYTAKHYSKICVENRSKDAVIYTIKKIMPLLPYAIVTTLMGWFTAAIVGVICEGDGIKDFVIRFLGDFSFDVLLISESFTHPFITPLWYISALIIVFPVFALFAQIRNRYTKLIISFIAPLMYYGWVGVSGNTNFPHDMLRVFVGMLLGLFLYEISEIFKNEFLKIPKILLTIIEILCFVYPIAGGYLNLGTSGYTSFRLYYLCFFIELLICLPGFSYTKKIGGEIFNFLGKLSMPVFIIHWYMATVVDLVSQYTGWGDTVKISVYYVGTIAIAAISMALVDRWRWFQEILKNPIVRID